MTEKICCLVGASELSEMPRGDFIIAADGGLDHLMKMGITPDLVIGDIDSAKSDVPKNIPLRRFKKEKDETDMYLAYIAGCELGYTAFLILGGSGGRLDHTLANHALLLHAAKHGQRIEMADSAYLTTVIYNSSVVFHIVKNDDQKDPPRGVSIFAIGSDANGVNIDGLEYEAHGITLRCDFPLGVSNRERGECFSVGCEDGALLVMVERRGLQSLFF